MTGAERIAVERERQIYDEGWTAEHDDKHADGELIGAARAYAWAAICEVAFKADAIAFKIVPNDFPTNWDKFWSKPSGMGVSKR